ncbi:DEAD/DEAH box helicase [Wenjunlia tyrosinilytica]|uniref:RNA helicase n=1 Tax=Wenjunlia tyrosinilytica TaxID=1544741 RepID=A0A917ZLH5_9ACTN|nr:DEAD/DEAH box helicase [Wenjunlia tyrosinilytica]GGO85144.1 hypothetical protein GCM10012280_18250 [Wenjunlia tyrosinilytica]
MSVTAADSFAMPIDDVDEQLNDATTAPETNVSETAVSETNASEAAVSMTGASETAPADEPTLTFGDLGLHEDIVRALAKRGVTTPFPIQSATIPDALAGKDILGRGRTGSGKTLSFGLPLLTRLADGGRTQAKRPRGIILTPTRELAMQVSDALEPYGSVLGLNLKVVCGGTSMPRQIYALERGVDILVATPGRLRDLIDRGACSLDKVEIAVLDEADQMADMGFLPEVTEILDLVPPGGQRMLFSATLENEIDSLVKRYLSNPVTHEVDPSAGAVTTMTHHLLVVKPKDKAPVTAAIAARKGRTIIFVRTQMGADRVAEQLIESGVRADALHGGMTQGARTRTLADFKDGYVNVLVATDVAARGIHVDGIDLVLNVDPAGDHKDYLHRSGRTARAGQSGTVVTLVLPHQRRSTFRLLEDAGVDASRHIVGGAFDGELAAITGARSLTEVQAESAANAAKQAEREVQDLTRQLEKVQRRADELRGDADRLAARAARERGEEVPAAGAEVTIPAQPAEPVVPVADEPAEKVEQPRREERSFDRRDDRSGGGYSRDRRDDRSAGGYSRDRRDDRGGRSFDRDRNDRDRDRAPRSFDRRDDRGGRSFERRDDRSGGGYSRDRRDDRSAGGYSRDRRDDRGGRSFDRDRAPRSFDRRDDRPSGGRSFDRPENRGHGHDRRDDRGGRSFDRDRAPRSFDRRDDRPSGSRAGVAERKPRWKRNG